MKRRGIYRRVNEASIDVSEPLRAGDYLAAVVTLSCGHARDWELRAISDHGRVYAVERPPRGLWCDECRLQGVEA